MYKYELVNNHYVVEINAKKYLIDTGSPASFGLNKPIKDLIIDGYAYPLKSESLDEKEIANFIGVNVDGFIGLDIICKTSLTIYKNGYLDFKVHDVNGSKIQLDRMKFYVNKVLAIDVKCEDVPGKFVIDIGAKYAYGTKAIFDNKKAFDHVYDYNPTLKRLDSDIFHLDIEIDGKKKAIDVCNNDVVYKNILQHFQYLIIGNITTFFDEVCVLDLAKMQLILK